MKNKKYSIAVVGMACRYPDADNPKQLWENILAKRVSFRKIPSVRLAEDYFSAEGSDPDATYSYKAAVLKNYIFPREKYKISKSVFETADLAHWVALDVAAEAIEDAKFNSLNEYKVTTGVFVGNTLTGEFSRANLLRLRWPYLSKVLIKQLREDGWEPDRIEKVINETEERFKSPFPVMTEDSLSGGLSNTIAGRICNYFDFNGGGYTVDGACSSSLLAISTACNAIVAGDLTIAIAGGVDLSLDPFELVGFSRNGALAKDRMLVFDKDSAGFLPGEGCGFIVMMNYQQAIKESLNIYAVINGWGISSDGQGGLTRPSTHGQLLSLTRAYNKSGYSINDVGYIEGHGTGTKVGDETEINTLSEAIKVSPEKSEPVYIGSVKANIGHTKAAAGIAGLMKAILCVNRQIIPPTTGNRDLHPVLTKNKQLQLAKEGKLWSEKKDLKASVSSMGFGGINTHVTLSSVSKSRRKTFKPYEKLLLSSAQTAEIFLFSSDTNESLKSQIQSVLNYAGKLSVAELIDLSFALQKKIYSGKYRAAIIADEPDFFVKKLQQVFEHIEKDNPVIDLNNGIFFSHADKGSKIGFLFPGQGTSTAAQSNFIGSKFPRIKNNHFDKNDADGHSTKHHQTIVVNSSIHALQMLNALNIKAEVAVGHSLGEITALYWAGVYSLDDLIRLVEFRGELMTQCTGSMLSVTADLKAVKSIINGKEISLACINTRNQLVLSGSDQAIAELQQELRQKKIPAVKLSVNGAFHSPLMKPLQLTFDNFLESISFRSPKRKVISTVLGRKIEKDDKIRNLLTDQFLYPVEFVNAIEAAGAKIDFWVEVGAGKTLTAMASAITSKPVASTDARSNDISELLKVVALNFSLNKDYSADYLFKNRFHRDFELDWKAEFIGNPCENLVIENIPIIKKSISKVKEMSIGNLKPGEFLSSFKEILSHHLQLPSSSLSSNARMLDDLHLNSITVGQLLARVSKQYNIAFPKTPTEYSNASIEEIAGYFESVAENRNGFASNEPTEIQGLRDWVRVFAVSLIEVRSFEREITYARESSWVGLVAGTLTEEKKELLDKVKSLPVKGIVVALLSDSESEIIETLVKSIQSLKEKKDIEHYVLIQNKNFATGFAKSIHLEKRDLKVTVITLNDSVNTTLIAGDIFFNSGFSEIIYQNGKRFVIQLKLIEKINLKKSRVINSEDIVLVTGGGKGITAECALELARETGCRLILVGRTERGHDEKLAGNLARFDAAGINYLYEIADLQSKEQLIAAVSKARQSYGEITALIHGAGINSPISFTSLDGEKIKKTVFPKVHGLQNCLSVLNADKLKSVVTFGSIIASSGMHGDADYALANEWMRNGVLDFKDKFPQCNCLNLEWSVWSGVGMGENLNVLEQLVSSGISPISNDNGVHNFLSLLDADLPSVSIIVSGRFGKLPTLAQENIELPLLRFLENVKVFYPGIEIISDFVLSGSNDPYLTDHKISGHFVFPGVMGLEAMMQAVTALGIESNMSISIKDVEFLRPITINPAETLNVRVLAIKLGNGEFETAVRCESTQFMMDHFRARFSYVETEKQTKKQNEVLYVNPSMEASEVYENLLFHTGRFRCLQTYNLLTPYSCSAVAKSKDESAWYGNYFSQTNLLGNPALRDAMLHSVQVCVPVQTLLPINVKEILINRNPRAGILQVEAEELYRDRDIFCYNIILKNSDGQVCEIWKEVKFSAMKVAEKRKLNLTFVQIALQRKVDEISPLKVCIDFSLNRFDLEEPKILRRADGKPFLSSDKFISVSYQNNIKMSVIGTAKVGCDIQNVIYEDFSIWNTLLGKERSELAVYISTTLKEDYSVSATRLWGAIECLKKSGANLTVGIAYEDSDQHGFVIFKTECHKIVSYCSWLNESNGLTVFSILT